MNDEHFWKLLYGETLCTFPSLSTPSTGLKNISIIKHSKISHINSLFLYFNFQCNPPHYIFNSKT